MDTRISLTDFEKEMKADIDHFCKYWMKNRKEQGPYNRDGSFAEDLTHYPMRLEPVDWYDQFLTFLSIQ